MLDIFGSDAFGVRALTDAVNKLPYVPGQIGSMGLFEEDSVTSPLIAVEEIDGELSLVPKTPRSGAATQLGTHKRTVRAFEIPSLKVEHRVSAEEVRGVREFGSEDQLQSVQAVVQRRLADMVRNIDVTLEYLRIGALKGTILDASGATIYNLFTEFGVSQVAEYDWSLDDAKDGAVYAMCNGIRRTMSTELGAMPVTRIHALCSSGFFDYLVKNEEVRDAHHRFAESAVLRGDDVGMRFRAYNGFEFGGIFFEEYRGSVGGTDFLDTNKMIAFPVVPGLFKTYYAPADFVETVNTIGRPRYAKQAIDAAFQRYVELHVQSNPLPMCLRPKVLIKGKAV